MRQFKVLTTRRFGRALALAIGLAPILTMTAGHAQEKPAIPMSVPEDWTHRHLIFSGPQSQAAADQLANEPRYWHQWLLHNRELPQGKQAPATVEQYSVPGMTSMFLAAQTAAASRKPQPQIQPTDNAFKQDWAMSLPAGATVGAGMYPAKFTFDVAATPSCTTDYVAYNTSLATGLAAASGTGTFSASSLTGTAVVNSVTLTASPGTAASQVTTISSNNVANGNTITITNGASSRILTASTPVAQVSRNLFDGTIATNDTFLTIAGIVYRFKTADWLAGTVTSGECFIKAINTAGTMASRLAPAINIGSNNTGSSLSSWQCGTNASQSDDGVTAAIVSTVNVDVTAKKLGSTGFTDTRSATGAHVTITTPTLGSDGSATSPNFQRWLGNAAADPTTLATNIANAIGPAAAVGVGASASSGVVTITASATGLAGNNINVKTTIPSGLTGAGFGGSVGINLTGGTSGTTSGTTFSTSTDSATSATNLTAEAAALASSINASVAGVTATSSAGVVTVTSDTLGTAGQITTTETFASGFSWSAVTAGTNASKPSIVAFNQLYSTQGPGGYCNQTGPQVVWSYAIGSGAVQTSPVLSLDGKKIMFVETKATGAVLHILQWKDVVEGTIAAPITPANVTDWADCAAGASCVVDVPFNGSKPATKSSPFYDYTNDALFVGDDNGVLHKFTPVIWGTPAEVNLGGWPLTVHGATILSSPVLDPNTSRIFVGDSSGTISYTTTSAAVPVSVAIGGTIVDAPIVDSSAGKIFVFVSNDLTGGVRQFDASLLNPKVANVAQGDTFNLYSGTFDNKYYTNGGTGNLFVCGKDGSNHAAIHRIPFTSGSMPASYTASYLSLASAGNVGCSPVTEFYNTSTRLDRIFLGIDTKGSDVFSSQGCPVNIGCLLSVDVTGKTWPPLNTNFTGYQTPSGGASGIVVDNAGGTTTVPSTTLNADATITQNTINVASTTGFAVGDYIQVDWEIMRISSIAAGSPGSLTLVNGGTDNRTAQLLTTRAAHTNGTAVVDRRLTTTNGSTGTGTTFNVLSTTTFKGETVANDGTGDYVQIESEVMYVKSKTTTSLTVTRGQFGSSAFTISHATGLQVENLGRYPQAASIYLSFNADASNNALCNGANSGGCAVKLTQNGLK
jgi:hypothetical protein